MGRTANGKPVYLRTFGPPRRRSTERRCPIDSTCSAKSIPRSSDGDQNWQNLKFPTGDTYSWEHDSTYIRKAPYFDGMPAKPAPVEDIKGARVLAVLGDSVTTDHISPAGSIK